LFLLALNLTFPVRGMTAVWRDALGREVQVAAEPERIVSLVPSVTETVFALGLGDRVVGVTTYCDYPAEALEKPKVGGYADPSLEAVVGLAPDLVFASADSTKPAFVSRLEAVGLAAYVVYPRSLADAAETMRSIGRVAGKPGEGDRLAGALEEAIRRARDAAARASASPPRVLLCVMMRPLVVAGPGTLADDLIRTAGGRNVVPAGPARFPTWGVEAVLREDPDVILVSAHPGEPDPLEFFRRWPELRAVAGGRVIVLEADWIHRPGPRLVRGLDAVSRALYGAAAPSRNSP
jgi:iron complex transport system substrate-binding protein